VDNGSITPTFGNYITESLHAVSISRGPAPPDMSVAVLQQHRWSPPVTRLDLASVAAVREFAGATSISLLTELT
jgi:hypothetical protein